MFLQNREMEKQRNPQNLEHTFFSLPVDFVCKINLQLQFEITSVFTCVMLYVAVAAAAAAAAFSPSSHMVPTTPTRAAVSAPVMSEMSTRRAALLGLAAAAVPLAANAKAEAVPVWKTKKTALGAQNKQPGNAKKCTVSKACATGAGLGWDPVALGVAGGATKPDGSNPRKFFKTPTYANQKEAE